RLLPSYLPYLLAQPGGGERLWAECVQKVREEGTGLDALLDRVPGTRPPQDGPFRTTLSQLRRGADFLKESLGLANKDKLAPDNLRRPVYQEDPQKLLDLADAGGKEQLGQVFQAIREIEAILETPWPSARERETLWKARLYLTRERNTRTRALDKADNRDEARTRVPKDLIEQEPRPRKERIAQQVRLVRSLFQLGGLRPEKLAKLHKAEEAFRAGGKKDSEALSQALRDAWVELVREAAAEKGPKLADRVSRVLHPFYQEGAGELWDADLRPAAQIRVAEARTYREWLGGYSQRASQDITDPEYKELYQQEAQEWAR